MPFYVYLLESRKTKSTYVGFTTNPHRRLRQHNREVKGGAGETRDDRPWFMILKVTGFKTNKEALKFEWMFQHPGTCARSRAAMKDAGLTEKDTSLKNKKRQLRVLLKLPNHKHLFIIKNC